MANTSSDAVDARSGLIAHRTMHALGLRGALASVLALGLVLAAAPSPAAADGSSWTGVPLPEFVSMTPRSVAHGNSVWIAVGETGPNGVGVQRSTDGALSWSGVDQGVGAGWEEVAFGSGVWVAVRNSTTPRTMRSPAGASGSSSQGQSSSTSSSSLTPLLSGGATPVVPAGEGVWQSADGSQVQLDVTSPAAGEVRYAADGLTVTLSGASSTSATNGLVVAPNGEIACEVCLDLVTGNVIETWLFSQPRLVAAHLVGVEPCQEFAIPVRAPLDGLGAVEAGTHTLQLALPTATGMQAINIGVTVGAPVPAAVPAGEGPAPLWPVLLAGLAGVALMRWGLRAEA